MVLLTRRRVVNLWRILAPVVVLFVGVSGTSAQHPEETNIMKYVAGHVWPITGLPRSYFVTDGYWQNIYSNFDRLGYAAASVDEGRQQERFIMQYGLNLYDGACWQIALCLSGGLTNIDRAAYHTRRLRTNQTLEWSLGTRGYTKTNEGVVVNLYGDSRTAFWGRENEDKSYYFRVISELYDDWDPLPGTGLWTTWQDWKPVTGENAWCLYIGPLQTAWFNYGGRIPWTDPGVEMGVCALAAVTAMQCRIGALYHVPTGVSGKAPNEISNENNFSMYAALRMFRQVLEQIRAAGGNLLRNPGFEEQGADVNDARFWQSSNPDYHGSVWGNAGRETMWAPHSGTSLAAIRGTWNGGLDYGGWWQEAPTREGLTNTLTAWFKSDTNWTATIQEWKLEFWNGDNWMICAVTQSLADVGANWGQRTLQAAAPVGSVWARAAVVVSGAGVSGALQFDDMSMTATPTLDVTGSIATVTAVLTNMDHYFEHYLINTNDGVFHTGGTYDRTNNVFTSYVFSGYWIGGPYRGSNLFSGTTTLGVGYTGTNLYNGYGSVQVTVITTNSPEQVNIRIPAAGPNEYVMTKVGNNYFRYTITGLSKGQTCSFKILIVGSGWGVADHSWVVHVDDPPQPYTTQCTNLFAVDCQTWGMSVLGAERVDSVLGENAAYSIWQNTKRYAGYFVSNSPSIHGVGFCDINDESNDVCTAEWTFGAILMCRNLARDYWQMGKQDIARSFALDAESMRAGVESLKVVVSNITTVTTSTNSGSRFTYDPNWANWGSPARTNIRTGVAWLYANKRYEIPFGWWANPLPSLASTAWSVMTDRDFDPFILGGCDTNKAERLVPWLAIRNVAVSHVTFDAKSMKIGHAYKLQRTDDFVTWQDYTTNIAGFLTSSIWTNVPIGASSRSYRLYRVN